MKTPRHLSSGIVETVAVLVLTLGLSGHTGCKPKLNTQSEEPDPLSEESEDWSDLVEPVPVEPEVVSYPFEKTIRNAAGQDLEGAILAKRGDQILFRRSVDGREFVVPFSNLSAEVQSEFARFPDASGEMIDAALAPATPKRESRLALGAAIVKHATFDEAKVAAEESGRPILVIFTGVPKASSPDSADEVGDKAAYRKAKRLSDGFKRSILGDSSFERFVNENFEFMHIDVPDPEKVSPEDRIAMQKAGGASGIYNFPVAAVLEANGRQIDMLWDFGSKGSRPFIEDLEKLIKYR